MAESLLHEAIVNSCNISLPRSRIGLIRSLLCFQIVNRNKSFAGEDTGLIPSPEWKMESFEADWYRRNDPVELGKDMLL
jgi:hypothetical protein